MQTNLGYEDAANLAGDYEEAMARDNGRCDCGRAYNDGGLCLDETCDGEAGDEPVRLVFAEGLSPWLLPDMRRQLADLRAYVAANRVPADVVGSMVAELEMRIEAEVGR